MDESTPSKPHSPAFDPETTAAMAMALDQVCRALNIDDDKPARATIAKRILDLARDGERDVMKLRDRVLQEARGGQL